MTGYIVDVHLPGPWWNPLAYASDVPLGEGLRVVVPVGSSHRVGFTGAPSEPPEGVEIRRIEAVLDERPLLGEDLRELALWISRRALCSVGTALATMTPKPLLEGEAFSPDEYVELPKPGQAFRERLLFDVDEERRWQVYLEELEGEERGKLLLFPEQAMAQRFWHQMPVSLRDRGLLWPTQGGRVRWEAWKAVRRGQAHFVVGSPGALFAPFPSLVLIAIEEEGHNSYQPQGGPMIHGRSVAAERARLAGSLLLLGGGLPSARVYRSRRPHSPKPPKGKIRFVDLRSVPGSLIQGVRDPLKISESLLEETLSVLKAGKKALWILDLKGFAGDVSSEDCGSSLTCRRCGAPNRLSGAGLLCPACGERESLPDQCPRCGGYLLQGNRPGLEALEEIASALSGADLPVRLWHAGLGTGQKRMDDLHSRGVVVGSRGALSLCDKGGVGLVGWIDADLEARKPFFDARHHAFRMIWESCWRGPDAFARQVLLQSRSPGKDWQKALLLGWDHFWQTELAEREVLALPPFAALVEIAGRRQTEAILRALRKAGLEVFEGELSQSPLWLSCERLSLIRQALEPFFDISRSRRGFPKLRVWTD